MKTLLIPMEDGQDLEPNAIIIIIIIIIVVIFMMKINMIFMMMMIIIIIIIIRRGKESETIQHITAACEQLAPTEYVKRHDGVAKIIHHKQGRSSRID